MFVEKNRAMLSEGLGQVAGGGKSSSMSTSTVFLDSLSIHEFRNLTAWGVACIACHLLRFVWRAFAGNG